MEKLELFRALLNQGNNDSEAKEIILEMREAVMNGADPEDLLYDYGLEPDYIFDILPY
jgi:hypothetical protein